VFENNYIEIAKVVRQAEIDEEGNNYFKIDLADRKKLWQNKFVRLDDVDENYRDANKKNEFYEDLEDVE